MRFVSENTDTGSVDSGFPTVSDVHFIDENDERRAQRERRLDKRKRKRHRKIRGKRRIIGPDGEVIYEVILNYLM